MANLYIAANSTFTGDTSSVKEIFAHNINIKEENTKYFKYQLINTLFQKMQSNKVKLVSVDLSLPFDINNMHTFFKPIFSQTTTGTNPYTHDFTELNDMKSLSMYITNTPKTINLKQVIPTSYNITFEPFKIPTFNVSLVGVESTTSRTTNSNTNYQIFTDFTNAVLTHSSTRKLLKANVQIDTNYKPSIYLDSTTTEKLVNHFYNCKITATVAGSSSDFSTNSSISGNLTIENNNQHFKILYTGSDIYTKDIKIADIDATEVVIECESFTVQFKNAASS